MMRELSNTKKIENCLLFLMNWHEIPRNRVKLNDWNCGAFACAGGWMTRMDDFRAKGVEPQRADYEEPTMPKLTDSFGNQLSGFPVANYLFGNSDLFESSYADPSNSRKQYDEVVERFEHQIVRLSTRGSEL